jgi:putative redox protein
MPHQIEATYEGELRNQAVHLASKSQIQTDAPVDNQGKGESFSPTDLVCAALATCGMTIMGIVAQREDIDLRGLQMSVTKVMADNPRRIARIVVDYRLPDGVSLSPQQAQKLKNAALSCPVAKSLHPDIEQIMNFDF